MKLHIVRLEVATGGVRQAVEDTKEENSADMLTKVALSANFNLRVNIYGFASFK